MGQRGTEVAREAADLVLADDDLATVVAAVEEGRRVYANVRRFLVYGLSGGAAEILVMLVGPFVGLPLPLLPAQILWVNLMTHGLAGVALGAEPSEPDVMRQRPRPPTESVLGAGLWQRIVRVGVVIATITLGVGLWAHATGRPWQSMVFLALGVTQLGVALGVRARAGTAANPFLLVAVAAAFALQVAGLYLPPCATCSAPSYSGSPTWRLPASPPSSATSRSGSITGWDARTRGQRKARPDPRTSWRRNLHRCLLVKGQRSQIEVD
jgi:Ca2+-transporting ATPase